MSSPANANLRRFLNIELLEDRTTPAAGIGLLGQYYDNIDFTNLKLNRTDATVNANYGSGSPDSSIAADTFSVRWSGQVEARYSEATTFTVTGDDGYRLWLNGQLLINRYVDQAPTATSGTINLVAGRRYDLVLEYYENGGGASIKMEWQSASQAREVVPAGQLFPAERGTITREVWNNITGTSVSNLTSNSNYPNSPTSSTAATSFEAPTNTADNYGTRMRGFLNVPATGAYTFYIAGDDNAQLWLSNSGEAGGKQQIASVPGYSNSRQWTKYTQQKSATVTLAAGQSYYIEALQKEGTGGDNLAVGWVRPGQTAVNVIAGEFLSPVQAGVSLFAESPTTAEGASAARFSVVRTGPTTNALTVRYTTRGTAINGTDYASLPGTITIPAGQASTTLNITPTADSLTEGNETVIVELQEASAYSVGRISERTATATVQDDAPAPTGGTNLWAGGTALANFDGFGGTFSEFNDAVRGPAIQAQVTTQPADPWLAQLRQVMASPVSVRKGDVLYVEFWARTTSGTGSFSAVFERSSSPYNKSLNQSLTVGTEWTKTQIPFIADDNYTGNQASFGFQIGQKIQTLQFAGFVVKGYGPPSNLAPDDTISLNNIGGTYGSRSVVNVSGQPFTRATQLTTSTVPPEGWRLQGYARTQSGLSSGETARIEFYARATSGASPRIDIAVQRTDTYESLSYQTITPTSTWTKYSYDVPVTQAFDSGGLQAVWNVGYGLQTVEIGGFTWKNISRTADINTLPKRTPATSYGGREGTAAWRTDADNRINGSRMANLTVNVRDAAGNAINGAVVSVRQTKHSFKFGTAVNAYGNLLDQSGTNPDAAKYQSELKRLFNTVVLENNLKWPNFVQDRQLGLDSAAWLKNQGYYQRGHNIVWPNRNPSYYMPESVWQQYDSVLASQGQAAANSYLSGAINDRIRDAVQSVGNNIGEWDVVNEPFANNDVMRILDGTTNGQPVANSVLLDWFRQVRQYNATVQRVLNDYDLFSNNGGNTSHRSNYEGWVDLLKAGGLIELLGEQSHYNEGNLTDISTLGTLVGQYASRWNLPVAITEFDVNTKDEQLQADYLRDYYTMAFSQGSVNELLMWGYWTKSHWLPDAALYRDDFSIKPNGQAYEDLVFGDWWTDTTGTSRNGSFSTRGFQGDYEITVTVNGQTKVVNATLGASGSTVTVVV
jgi:GH35 family endo-1,4-beta-xylanase